VTNAIFASVLSPVFGFSWFVVIGWKFLTLLSEIGDRTMKHIRDYRRWWASELVAAIREVLRGRRYVSPLIGIDGLELMKAASRPGTSFSNRLTHRQREVLQLVAEGRTRKEIAASLSIAVKTVEFHKAALSRGFHLRTTADFTKYAIEHALIRINST
jgi:DNA-binding CsgD family transcriptional regulator